MGMLKKFTDWYHGNNETEKEPPRGGVKRVIYILWNDMGKMITINVLFLLSCIPVVTIPAAISALNAYVGKIFRVGYGMDYTDYWKEYRQGIIKNLPLGLITGGVGFYAYYLLSLANNFSQNEKDILTGIGVGVMVIAIMLVSYIFVLTSIVDLPIRHILRNTLILILVEWKTSFLVVVVESILLGFFLLATAPYSLFFLILLGFSLQQVIVCAMILPVIQKRVIIKSE